MRRRLALGLLGLLPLVGCGTGSKGPAPDKTEAAPPPPSQTKMPKPGSPAVGDTAPLQGKSPQAYFSGGTPTFVVGTTGSEACTRANRGQVRFLAGSFFPDAKVVDDKDVDDEAWPEHAVLYGAPHCHGLLEDLALPFTMSEHALQIGGRTYNGPGVQLVTVLPAREGDGGHPEFLLYAGTGQHGTAEINALGATNQVIAVGDAHGLRATGRWVRDEAGRTVAELGKDARRVEWRTRETKVDTPSGPIEITAKFVAFVDPAKDEDEVIAAVERGVGTLVTRGGLKGPAKLDVYVYPDVRSKQSLTGKLGDGHATPAAHALHIVADAPRVPNLPPLVAHETTHVLLRAQWGAPGTALLGEGIAVWVAGQYAGTEVADLTAKTKMRPVPDLLGKGSFETDEADRYAFGALLADVAIETVGLQKTIAHLYPATPATWADACKAAGTSAEALEAALNKRFAG